MVVRWSLDTWSRQDDWMSNALHTVIVHPRSRPLHRDGSGLKRANCQPRAVTPTGTSTTAHGDDGLKQRVAL